MVGLATTTLVLDKPSVLLAAVKVATIWVLAPTGKGPMSVQWIDPSLTLSSEAGTDDTYVRSFVS